MSEPESLTERELAEDLLKTVFSGEPPEATTPVEDEPEEEIVVHDEPVQPEAPAEVPEASDVPTEPAPELEEEVEEPTEVEEEEPSHIVWAKKKYGDDPDQWAKAAFEQEQMISRQGGQLKEAQQVGSQWYDYAMGLEQQLQQAQVAQQTEMPLSSAEEEWVESNMSNPLGAAMQAAFNGKFGLYNAVLEQVASENPQMAMGIAQQVQAALYQAQQNAEAAAQPPDLKDQLAASVERLGIDVPQYGEQMMGKIEELGVEHPFVKTILNGEDEARDVALLAVLDLVRTGSTVTRRVKDDERSAAIKKEAELRKAAAGVVTGAPHSTPPKEDPFLAAMTEEWKARQQWGGE